MPRGRDTLADETVSDSGSVGGLIRNSDRTGTCPFRFVSGIRAIVLSMKTSSSLVRLVCGGVLAVAVAMPVACGGGGGGGGGAINNPPTPQPSMSSLPTVHLNFFGSANGVFHDATFGNVSGFTQQLHAQVLGVSPGTMIMVTNSDAVSHTINVMAAFPTPGPQSTAAAPNGGIFGVGYQSGVLAPGQSVGPLMVTGTTGKLFVICGIHFALGMRDGAIVQVGATPGPQATSAPGTCHGYGC